MKNKFLPITILSVVALAAAFTEVGPAVKAGGPIVTGDVAWMLSATALVLFMTPGLAFFYGGMVRGKNVISTMLQSFVSMGLISVLWVAVAFSLAFGDSIGGIIGDPRTFFMFKGVTGATHAELSPTIPFLLFALFQLKFAVITPALITGAFAERIKFTSYMLFITLFMVFIYAPLAHMTWHPQGLLKNLGVLDFAGGTVVHMSAGFAALAGAWVLGKRKLDDSHTPANIPFIILGTGMLWFGWFGFNAGSALAANEQAALALATTNTASAAAALAWIFFDMMRGKKPSAVGACIGAVVGLVAITPAAGFVSIGASLFIGAFSAVVSQTALALKHHSKVDDTLDVFACHGLGGAMGMLCTGIFAKDVGLVFGSSTTFVMHVAALGMVAAFAFLGSFLLFKITDWFIPLRVSEKDELDGLDLSQHGESVFGEEGKVQENYVAPLFSPIFKTHITTTGSSGV